MEQIIDSGEVLFFGQSLPEVEALFSCRAVDEALPGVSRRGIDRIIKLKDVYLQFDTDRLKGIEFRYPYKFINPLTPYPEVWKNLDKIGEKKIYGRISRKEFLSYLSAWEQKAAASGVLKNDLSDFTANHYVITFERNTFIDMIHIRMGPSRKTGGKGTWSDGWTFFLLSNPNATILEERLDCLNPRVLFETNLIR